MVEMSFLETLKTFLPEKKVFKKSELYLLCTNLKMRRVLKGQYSSVEELRKVLVEEIQELEANQHHLHKTYWCPDDASFNEIRLRLQSLFRMSEESHPRKKSINKYLDELEPTREAWHYCY